MYKFIITTLFMFMSFCIQAAELRFEKFNVEDGLSHEVVRGVLQDQAGFLWIATEGGINRFDGFSFSEFKFSSGEQTASNVVSDMTIDQKGRIWLATLGSGVLLFDPKTLQFESILSDQLTSLQVVKIFIDSSGRIWAGTLENGLNMLKVEGQSYQLETFRNGAPGVSHPSITAFAEDNLGRIWVGSDGGGVDIYQPATNSWQNLKHISKSGSALNNERVRSLYKDSKGDIWIGTASNGVFKYKTNDKSLQQYQHEAGNLRSLGNDRVLDIYQDERGQMWFGTDAGLSIFNDDYFETISSSRLNPNSLSNNRVLSIFQDNTGLMWFGTYGGLNKWNPATSFFNHTIPTSPSGLEHTNVLDFSQDSAGAMYMATYGGGIVKESEKHVWESISSENGLPDNRIVSLLVDDQDGLWVGTRSHGLWYRPEGDENWQQYQFQKDDPESLPSNGITDIYQDSLGNIWVATYAGGVSKKTNTGFQTLKKEGSPQEGLSSKNVFQVIEDRDGFIWLATDNGINLIDPDDYSVQHFLTAGSADSNHGTQLTWNLFEDSAGNFWIATQGHGVLLWRYADRVQRLTNFEYLNTESGLPHDTVYGFEQDETGNVWLSSARGLAKINPDTLEVTTFNVSHGLQGYDFNLGASYRDDSGFIYFGGTNGYNRFTEQEIKRNTLPPKIQLTHITTVDNRIRLPLKNDYLELDYTDYLVAFDFVALDFAAPQKNQYQYRLEPFDTNWIFVGNLRRATYTNLPAGEYTFQVRAANNDGIWSNEQVNLPVKVTPAPWRTPLAYSAYALVTAILLLLFLRGHMKKLAQEEKQRKELESQVAQRTEELAQQNQQLLKLNRELEQAHVEDALTGCKNRHFLDLYLKKALPEYEEQANHQMLVLLIDLDNLKPFNDSLGHAAGDALITHMAKVFKASLLPDFHLVRWGGDEFMIVGPVSDKQQSVDYAKSISEQVNSNQFVWLDNKVNCQCSMGFAHYPFDESAPKALSWDQVSMLADKALYSAKQTEGISWSGVMAPKREINELMLSELMHCQRISQVEDLVEVQHS